MTVNTLKYFALSFFVIVVWHLSVAVPVIAQSTSEKRIVQVSGILTAEDSMFILSDATVEVRSKNKGVNTNRYGVYSIVCEPGDTLIYSSLGFKEAEYIVPSLANSQYVIHNQILAQDTFLLPEAFISHLPHGEDFDYAFKYWDVKNDHIYIARQNNNKLIIRYLLSTLPKDGRENAKEYQNQSAIQATYGGQLVAPQQIMNPLAWAELFEAWKRGDFRKKR